KLDPDLRYNELMAGLDQLDVIQPVHELWKLRDLVGANEDLEYRVTSYADGTADAFMAAVQTEHPEFHAAFEEFLSRFYYRAEVELDISVPRWSENPDFVISSLKALVKNGDPVRRPEVSENRKHQIFEEALARAERAFEKGGVFTRLGRKAFHAKLERLRRYAWLREEMRDRSTRTYFFLRRFALECGRRLNERMPGAVKSENDIFYLEFTEIARALSQEMTEKEAASLIEIRRLYADGYRNYRNPNEIGARWNAGAAKASNILAPKNAKSWSGIACSTGVVRGRARVVRNLKEAGKLEKGDILIAPFTDPGWTPLFSIVSGVVTETGGLLSHAALISREYAMPAVLNIPGATGFIRDGQEIVVDGRTGTVHLVEA
ncbi:MAG: PEP-utilizing enzyme, partial [Bdellovibrionia bacterium]